MKVHGVLSWEGSQDVLNDGKYHGSKSSNGGRKVVLKEAAVDQIQIMTLEDGAIDDLAVVSPPDLFSRDGRGASNMTRSQAEIRSPERNGERDTRWRCFRSFRSSQRVNS